MRSSSIEIWSGNSATFKAPIMSCVLMLRRSSPCTNLLFFAYWYLNNTVERLNPNAAIGFIGFSHRAPCTKLHKVKQKDRKKTLAEFPGHILNDYVAIFGVKFSTNKTPFLLENARCLFRYFYRITLFVKTLYIYYLNISLSNYFFWSPKRFKKEA